MTLALVSSNAKPSKNKPSKRRLADNEFLPAALEILETPTSPIRVALIWFICVLAFGTILWSYFGTFDIVSTAQGKIQPTGRVKVIQSIEMGKTKAVPVSNGAKVKKGDIIVELDETELGAEEGQLRSNLNAFRAELIRRTAELAIVANWRGQATWSGGRLVPDNALPFHVGTPANIRMREQGIFAADLSQLDATMSNLSAQRALQQATVQRLERMITSQNILVATLAQRVSMRANLVTIDAGTRAGVIDASEVLQKEEANLSERIGQLAEATASLAVAASEEEKTIRTFVTDNVQRAGDAARQADDLEQQLIKATKRRASMTLFAPADGTVQASAITTVGQVVSAGAELMRIVPDGSSFEIEAYLPNSDVGFVSAGQPAVIKVEAFPFTRYGVLHGVVSRVATDAIPEPDAQQLEAQPAKELQNIIPSGNVQRVQNLVFPVTIAPDVTTIDVEGNMQQLSPGMAVTVEIKTGRRRILEYFFSPIAKIAAEAMNER